MHYSVGVGSEDSFQDLVSSALLSQGVSAAPFVNFGGGSSDRSKLLSHLALLGGLRLSGSYSKCCIAPSHL